MPDGLSIVCCNGALPFVDLHLWPHQHSQFRSLDLTDWVATDESAADWLRAHSGWQSYNSHNDTFLCNATEDLAALMGGDEGGNETSSAVLLARANCDLYNLTFSSDSLSQLYDRLNGSLACDCPSRTHGRACQHILTSASLVWSDAASSLVGRSALTMFTLVVLLPVCFVLFAILGALLVRVCFLDLPACWLYLDGVRQRRRQRQYEHKQSLIHQSSTSSSTKMGCVQSQSQSSGGPGGQSSTGGRTGHRAGSVESGRLEPDLVDRLLARAEQKSGNGQQRTMGPSTDHWSSGGPSAPPPPPPCAGMGGGSAHPMAGSDDVYMPTTTTMMSHGHHDYTTGYGGHNRPPASPPPSYKSVESGGSGGYRSGRCSPVRQQQQQQRPSRHTNV